MQTDSPIYQKAFQRYLRYGVSIEMQIKAAERTTTHYIWRTQGDSRVRPEHAARDGQIFAWDDSTVNPPGTDYGCRCHAEPYYGFTDPPIEPVYPIEAVLSLMTGGQALIAARSLGQLWRNGVSARNIRGAAKAIEDYLGGPGVVKLSRAGDPMFIKGNRKIRFDIKNTAPHNEPHFHIEKQTENGNWRNVGKQRYPFKE